MSLAETSKSIESAHMYNEDDKIMVLETGEVLTVISDFTDEVELGIVVKEKFGRNLSAWEVRPAGRTRQRLEAAGDFVPSLPFSLPYRPA
jgi:hypothetical protein